MIEKLWRKKTTTAAAIPAATTTIITQNSDSHAKNHHSENEYHVVVHHLILLVKPIGTTISTRTPGYHGRSPRVPRHSLHASNSAATKHPPEEVLKMEKRHPFLFLVLKKPKTSRKSAVRFTQFFVDYLFVFLGGHNNFWGNAKLFHMGGFWAIFWFL